MDQRVAVALLLLAIPLIGYPILSPPPDPPDRLVHEVSDFQGPDDPDKIEGAPVIRYENLSERGQELFDAARTDSPYRVAVGNGASEFRYEPFGMVIVHFESENYRLTTTRVYTGPTTSSIVLRLGSLITGIVAGTVGGYGWVNAEG